jgi:hypothetical protein
MYLRSISSEHGRRVLLTGENCDLVGSSDHEGDTYRLDWNEFFSLGRSHVLKPRAMGQWVVTGFVFTVWVVNSMS